MKKIIVSLLILAFSLSSCCDKAKVNEYPTNKFTVESTVIFNGKKLTVINVRSRRDNDNLHYYLYKLEDERGEIYQIPEQYLILMTLQ